MNNKNENYRNNENLKWYQLTQCVIENGSSLFVFKNNPGNNPSDDDLSLEDLIGLACSPMGMASLRVFKQTPSSKFSQSLQKRPKNGKSVSTIDTMDST